MLMSLTGNLRFRLDGVLKERWIATCDARKISQQEAVNALIGWFTSQDELTQLMIFQQVTPKPDLIETVLQRMDQTPASVRGRILGEKDAPRDDIEPVTTAMKVKGRPPHPSKVKERN